MIKILHYIAISGYHGAMPHTLRESDLSQEPVFLMARASSLGSATANRALADLGLKVRHYSVLSLVCGKKNPTQRELSYHLVLDPSQIVLIVDALEKKGLVQRQTDPNDRRSKIIVPTTEGQKLYKKAKVAVETSSDRTLSNLSDEERANLLGMLRKISLD